VLILSNLALPDTFWEEREKARAGRFPRRESVENRHSIGAPSCPYAVLSDRNSFPLRSFFVPPRAMKKVSGRELEPRRRSISEDALTIFYSIDKGGIFL
jgi:hypothetical protein